METGENWACPECGVNVRDVKLPLGRHGPGVVFDHVRYECTSGIDHLPEDWSPTWKPAEAPQEEPVTA